MLLSQKQLPNILDEVQEKFGRILGQSWSVVAPKVASLPDGSAAVSDKLTIWNGKDTFVLDCNDKTCQLSKLTFEKKEGWGIPFIWGCTSYNPQSNPEEISIGKFGMPDSMIFNSGKDAGDTKHPLDQADQLSQEDTSEPEKNYDADVVSDRDIEAKDSDIGGDSANEPDAMASSDAFITSTDVNNIDQTAQEIFSSSDADDIQITQKPDEFNSQDSDNTSDADNDQFISKLDENAPKDYEETNDAQNLYCVPKPPLPCIDPNNDGDLSDAIIDPQLRTVIQKALKTTIISVATANKLTQLNAQVSGIVTLAGLQCFTSLQVLDVSTNQIKDLSPLQGLLQLKELNVSNNLWGSLPIQTVKSISDITPLIGLTQLYSLDLSNNPKISDYEPLQCLTQLKHLDLANNPIKDITPLQGLTQLEWLQLVRGQIKDISPLQGLTKLQFLALNGNQISDITPLQYLPQLSQELDLSNNKISNIGPLQSLTKLKVLALGNEPDIGGTYDEYGVEIFINQVADFSPLQKLTQLESLYLQGSKIGSIIFLQGLTNLTMLKLNINNINDITTLIQNPGMVKGVKEVNLRINPVSQSQINTLRNKGVVVCFDDSNLCF